MTYEEFAKKFIEVACEAEGDEMLTHKTAMETAWKAFGRLLVEKGLALTPSDPAQFCKGEHCGNCKE